MSYDLVCGITHLDHSRGSNSGSAQVEDKDQDIIDKLILRAGNYSGWPVYLSKDRYADYQARSAKGDHRCKEVIAILDRHIKDGRLRVSDERKGDFARYPIGNEGDDRSPERRRLEEQARNGDLTAILKLKRLREEEAMAVRGWPSPLMMHGDPFVRDEARAQGEDGSSSCGSSIGDGLSHGEYRALIMKQAIRQAGGSRPSTKHLFAAKSRVDRALGNARVAIYIPGARPGRKTV
jgi:hypothetical protein